MAVIEKFLGKTVTIPEDRLYALQTGIWAKAASQEIFFGLTEPALVLTGGANSLDWLVENGQKNTDGFKNPEGVSGGVSGICKAVYSGIRDQKF